jgi:hypothetical protein
MASCAEIDVAIRPPALIRLSAVDIPELELSAADLPKLESTRTRGSIQAVKGWRL